MNFQKTKYYKRIIFLLYLMQLGRYLEGAGVSDLMICEPVAASKNKQNKSKQERNLSLSSWHNISCKVFFYIRKRLIKTI